MTDNFPLPASYKFGKVVGRVIHAVADTPEDPDALPQARAATGKVVFTPTERIRKVVDADYPAIAMHEQFESTLNSTGRLTDSEGRVGIWLLEGEWRVDFQLDSGSIDPFDITVSPDHTELLPLDILDDMPYVPPANVTVQTLVVPSGGNIGDSLVRSSSGGIEWSSVESEPTVTQDQMEEAIIAHSNDPTPHPAYDDIPSLTLLYMAART